jgi:hypothetical protein
MSSPFTNSLAVLFPMDLPQRRRGQKCAWGHRAYRASDSNTRDTVRQGEADSGKQRVGNREEHNGRSGYSRARAGSDDRYIFRTAIRRAVFVVDALDTSLVGLDLASPKRPFMAFGSGTHENSHWRCRAGDA